MTGTARCRMMKVKIGSPGGNERGALECTPGYFFHQFSQEVIMKEKYYPLHCDLLHPIQEKWADEIRKSILLPDMEEIFDRQ